MELAQRLDDYGKPAWITAMILGFFFFWPIGLGILFYMIWSGRMGCSSRKRGNWMWGAKRQEGRHNGPHNGPMWAKRHASGFAPSGNMAFDEYRQDTLKRLEDEFGEFQSFLDQLRMAKDKEEFDKFMSSRDKGVDASVIEAKKKGKGKSNPTAPENGR